MEEKKILETYEEKRARVQEFNLTSDLFAGKVFEDVEACQELCRILLQDQSVVLKSVRTQYVIRNLETHSIELDILAEQDSGDMIGIELQMYPETAPFRRTRYYLSGIDMSILEKGKDYVELPAVTIAYITKEDIIGGGMGYYPVERRTTCVKTEIKEGNNIVDVSNGVKEQYFNLEYSTGNNDIDELFQYFKDSDPYYQTETFPRIVERVRYLKMHKKGVNIMCEIADRIRNEGREEGRKEGRMRGMVDAILELLEELGQVPQRIVDLISAEENLSVLSRWHKSAAKAASIAEFEANM